MSAEGTLANAVIELLGEALAGQVNGVFAGPPVKASAPWVELGPVVAVDWSVKDAPGREVRLVLSIRDRTEEALRTHAIAAAAGLAIEAMPRDLDGWRIASIVFVRARVTGTRPAEWAASLEYRVRLLAAH